MQCRFDFHALVNVLLGQRPRGRLLKQVPSSTMSKSKGATKPSKKDSKKAVPAVKEGRVTKPAQTPKAKSKEIAKSAAAKVDKKSKKSKKEPTPEPESSSSESESEADSDSSTDSSDEEVDTKTPAKTKGTAKAAPVKAAADSSDSSDSSDEESDSSSSSSEADNAPKPSAAKANGTAKPVAKDESDSDSSDSDSESDEEAAPAKAKEAEKADASSDSDSESDSDASDSSSNSSSSDDEEDAPTKKRKAEEEAEPVIKKAKTEVADEGIKNLFVGNLSWNVDEDWLAREFDGFGEITGCRIITDRETQRPKGFGYVEFATSEAAAKAKAEMHDKDLDGRPLNVDFSTPRQNNANPKDKSNNRAARFGDKPSVPSNTLFIGNLSFDSSNESIHEAFSAYGEISRVSLPTDRETGAPKGFGYVDYGTVDEAKAALEALNGYEVDGRPIRVDYATPRDNSGGAGGRGGFGGGRGGGRGGRGGFGDRGGRGGGRGGRGGFSDRGGRGGRGGSRGSTTNRGGFGDFQGKKMAF
ncbi:RNA-binding domain-containing protein [Byssothecium circinans]|uniref:RNA-binding domain-containing protein n=1 Tax=Byssothecium circinans TaxID=147558 RepID=A0A6A5THJ9_9PLEO|nr:RNA-binding domain-containing protein [Byssothecium circinans]